MPCGLPAALPVGHALVAPDVVDGVQLPQLGEQAGVGDVGPHVGPELDPLGPVVAPVIHGARLQGIGSRTSLFDIVSQVLIGTVPDVVNIVANSLVGTGPEGEGLG